MKSKYISSLLITITAISLGIFSGKAVAEKSPTVGSEVASEAVFSCQSNKGSVNTVAKTNDGSWQPIFYWNNDPEITFFNPQQLCDSVSQKLNNYLAEGNDLSSVTFKAQEQMGLPAICVAEQYQQCSLLLFTLKPSSRPYDYANRALASILNQDLQASPIKSQNRGVQSIAYEVNFWQLLGWK